MKRETAMRFPTFVILVMAIGSTAAQLNEFTHGAAPAVPWDGTRTG